MGFKVMGIVEYHENLTQRRRGAESFEESLDNATKIYPFPTL